MTQSEAPAWKIPEPQSTAPKTNEQIDAFIESVASDCRTRGLDDKFEDWLKLQRNEGKSDRQIAHELWNVAHIFDDIRQDSEKHGCLEQLDNWLAAEANTKLNVELAAELIHAKDRIGTALKFAQAHGQEHVFQAFLQRARKQGKPDVVLISELSADGVPPWAPPVPKEGPAPVNSEEIEATLKEARNASKYRGLEKKFPTWFEKNQKLMKQNRTQIASALVNAPHIIRRIRDESEKNGCLDQLDGWLVSAASTKLDVELASELTHAEEKLQHAQVVARQNGRERVFLKFINKARGKGKPDVVIVSELLQDGTPPWMPDWVPPVPQEHPPAKDKEALELIEETEEACANRWLGAQFENWIKTQRLVGKKSDLEIAHTLWEAAHTIHRIRDESKARNCLKQLDQWLVLQAKKKLDVELAAHLIMAEKELSKRHDSAQENGQDALVTFIEEARRKKPDVIILDELIETQDPSAITKRQAAALQEHHQAAFKQERQEWKKTGPSDKDALPAWVPPEPPPDSPPQSVIEIDDTIEKSEKELDHGDKLAQSDREIHDTIEKARKRHKDRWLDEEFKDWLGGLRMEKNSDILIAKALREAAVTIHRARKESEAKGCLVRLDAWLSEAAETMLDTELAAALTQATTGLEEAREAARENGQEDVFQTFVDDARAQGKPDVIIFEEWSGSGASQ